MERHLRVKIPAANCIAGGANGHLRHNPSKIRILELSERRTVHRAFNPVAPGAACGKVIERRPLDGLHSRALCKNYCYAKDRSGESQMPNHGNFISIR